MSDQKETPNEQPEVTSQEEAQAQAEPAKTDPWTGNEIQAEAASESTAKTQPVEEKATADEGKNAWQQDLVNRLAFASLNEQRRSRRWGIFFKSLTFIYLFVILFMIAQKADTPEISLRPHTAVVEILGPIMDTAPSSADNIITGLRDAFKNNQVKGVILRINSPGGSPVQAGYIYDEIVRLRGLHPDKPIYAVTTDICASAAYYIASATDKIYADKASIVGSIGVLMDGYGFVKAIDKLGIERRLMTAGENKAFLDPFSPVKEKHKEHMQGMLDNIHRQFIKAVKDGRGDRLADNPDIFSGLVWSGDKSQELGLVDGLGNSSYVAREIIGAEKLVDYTPRQDFFERFANQVGAAAATAISSTLFTPALR